MRDTIQPYTTNGAHDMSKFIEYVGNTWINGKSVAAYAKDGGIQIRAETTGNKIISKPIDISVEEYEALKAEWREGPTHHQDAIVTARALRHVGINV